MNAVTVAMRSFAEMFWARAFSQMTAPYCVPNNSRPVVFGGGIFKYGSFNNSCNNFSCTRPCAPRVPSRSNVSAPFVTRNTASSINMLPGPVSNANALCDGERNVALPMPPIFCNARVSVGCVNKSWSTYGTIGAPCPPAAMSRVRKLLTTGRLVISAITAGSAICNVDASSPVGICQTVCP